MQLSGHTVLVTGGASGIGLALVERFLAEGNDLLGCGRREEKLEEFRRKHPRVKARACDVATVAGREDLFRWATAEAPELNVLVHNAGIQRRLRLSEAEWAQVHEELAINLEAPLHLTQLFLPHLERCPGAAILNITSGLSFVPLANVPIYCATKAALHSLTLSLRHQLKATGVEVIEIIPPAVNTDLGGPGLHTFGVPVGEFADHVFARLAAGDREIAYGFSEETIRAGKQERDAIFERMNAPRGSR